MNVEFKYKPKIADLIDRLSIDILKSIFITDYRKEYRNEMFDIRHDLNILIEEKKSQGINLDAQDIYAIICIALTNREIWLNESKARKGDSDQDKLLKFTHSINGQRNSAKNIISDSLNDRKDLKIDCLAAEFKSDDFIKEHGNWDILEDWRINENND